METGLNRSESSRNSRPPYVNFAGVCLGLARRSAGQKFLQKTPPYPGVCRVWHNSGVSLKRFCLVPATWSLETYSNHTCADRSHLHLSRRQVWDLERDGEVEWLHAPVNRHDKGVVRLCRTYAVRGLSARIGALLAQAAAMRLPWAEVMLSEIRLRPASEAHE